MDTVLHSFSFVSVLIRLLLAVVIGGVIGNERARHGRAAGMRTHVLVCVGAAMTSLTSVFVAESFSYTGDIFRISAQVISGIGFLGAGMILIKNNSMITGLTTAAGMWATAAIGVAVGYGFYSGAIAAAVICLVTIVVLAHFEKEKRFTERIYLEADDMYSVNALLKEIEQLDAGSFEAQVMPPKSSCQGHIGIELVSKDDVKFDVQQLCTLSHIVFAVEE